MRRDGCIVVHLLPQTSDFFRLYDIKIAQERPGFDVFSGLPSNAIIALIWEPFKTMIYSLPKYLNELGAFSRISTTLSISEAVYVVYIPSSVVCGRKRKESPNLTMKRHYHHQRKISSRWDKRFCLRENETFPVKGFTVEPRLNKRLYNEGFTSARPKLHWV